MTTDEQLVIINDTQFFNDLRAKMMDIHTAMETSGFSLRGDIFTEVNGIAVVANFPNVDVKVVHLGVGNADDGQALFQWNAPIGWLTPPPAPVV